MLFSLPPSPGTRAGGELELLQPHPKDTPFSCGRGTGVAWCTLCLLPGNTIQSSGNNSKAEMQKTSDDDGNITLYVSVVKSE